MYDIGQSLSPGVKRDTQTFNTNRTKDSLFQESSISETYRRTQAFATLIGGSALTEVRAQLPLKSPNKHYGLRFSADNSIVAVESPIEKRNRYCKEAYIERCYNMDNIRAQRRKLRLDCRMLGQKPDVSTYARMIRSHKNKAAGNCHEYAILMHDWLSNNLKSDDFHDIVYFKYPGDHVFNIVNQPKNADGTYPKWDDCDEKAIVFDGWLNVVCPAREYPKQWKQKMHKWAGRGIKLGCSKKIESPLDPKWLNMVNECEIISDLP